MFQAIRFTQHNGRISNTTHYGVSHETLEAAQAAVEKYWQTASPNDRALTAGFIILKPETFNVQIVARPPQPAVPAVPPLTFQRNYVLTLP